MKGLPFSFATYVPAILNQGSSMETIVLTEKTCHDTSTYHRMNLQDVPNARHGAE
jgi:hypothetical protein